MPKADRVTGIMAGILGFMACCIAPNSGGTGFASPSLPQGQPSFPATGIIGTWTGRLEGDGSMDIDPAPGGFKVVLRVSSPSGCACSIEGFGTLTGNTLTLTGEKNGQICAIGIRFEGETAEVNEHNCSNYRGTGCGFTGTLKKID